MYATDFRQRLEQTKEAIPKITADLQAAKKEKEEAPVAGKKNEATAADQRLQKLQKQLEDLTFTKAALEGKLRVYGQNKPAAAELRKKVAANWERERELYAKLIPFGEQVRRIMSDMGPPSVENQALAREYLALTGETLTIPRFFLPPEVINFTTVRMKPSAPWQYMSPEENEARIAKAEAERKASDEKRAQKFREQAPICAAPILGGTCDLRMLVREDVSPSLDRSGKGVWVDFMCKSPEHSARIQSVLVEV